MGVLKVDRLKCNDPGLFVNSHTQMKFDGKNINIYPKGVKTYVGDYKFISQKVEFSIMETLLKESKQYQVSISRDNFLQKTLVEYRASKNDLSKGPIKNSFLF